jgi:hypothetical protein
MLERGFLLRSEMLGDVSLWDISRNIEVLCSLQV